MSADRKALLESLGAKLRAHKLKAEMTADGLHVTNPWVEGCCPRHPYALVVARSRREDGDRMWFWTLGGYPLAEADHFVDAIVAIKGLVAGNQAPSRVGREPDAEVTP